MMNVLNVTELFAFKWLIVCYVGLILPQYKKNGQSKQFTKKGTIIALNIWRFRGSTSPLKKAIQKQKAKN